MIRSEFTLCKGVGLTFGAYPSQGDDDLVKEFQRKLTGMADDDSVYDVSDC
jgi:hypothetical protein